MAEVILNEVCKSYAKGALAVNRFSLKICDGEFLVLVGPSGCGKSTTLRMIAGLEEITSGTIHIDERCVNAVPPKDRDLAMVFQNYALYPHMTVFKNMAFGLKLRGLPKAEIHARVTEAAAILGLEELMERLPKQLSGGQRQRVAVGRAIVRKPKVFLFDEPLSNLDAKMRVEMRSELQRLHRRLKATMIYVTHDQTEAMTMGDRIVVMAGGSIQQAASPREVYRRPQNRFVAGFIGTPPMNFIRGALDREAEHLIFRTADQRWVPLSDQNTAKMSAYVGRTILLGFRPEAISLSPKAASGAGFDGIVDVVEPMGAETFVQILLTDGTRITVRVSPDCRLHAGETLFFHPEMHQVLFFDPDSEQLIENA